MKKMVFFTGLAFAVITAEAQLFVFKATADLNADGKMEQISLEIIPGTYDQFVLRIADQEVRGKLDENIDGFRIIDINKNDKYKEVAVHTSGPSDDDEYLIYWYDGEKIIHMAHLSRWPTFPGNGIVYVDTWEGFWKRRDKYQLDDRSRKLNHVPQFAYYVGVKVSVVNSFPIYRNTDLKDQVALLSKGSEIELLICDIKDRNWLDYVYLIRAGSGLTGWARFEVIFENAGGFPMAD